MKRTLTLLALVVCAAFASAQSPSSPAWYNINGNLQSFEKQADVYAFRLKNGLDADSVFSSSVADSILYYPGHGINALLFSFGTPSEEREAEITRIQMLKSYERDYEVISTENAKPYFSSDWWILDDQVNVLFNNPDIQDNELSAFMSQWGLELVFQPSESLPSGVSFPYTFRVIEPNLYSSPLAKAIHEQNGQTVEVVEPNVIDIIRPLGNDPLLANQWYVHNNGQGVSGGHPSSLDADCDIDLMWGVGLSGAGIRVAVLDGFGFDLDHEDMRGQFVEPYTAFFDTVLQPFPNQLGLWNVGHGTLVSGIIGARGENNIGIKGVAHNAEVMPIEIWPSDVAVVSRGFLEALEKKADIINCSWYLNMPVDSSILFSILDQVKILGRGGAGMVIVAGSPNEAEEKKALPAAWKETIGIMGSDPEDFLRTGVWTGGTKGSNWGEWYDVAAPSVSITSTDNSGISHFTPSSPDNYYNFFNGNSAATPIVSGICALLLEQTPSLLSRKTNDEVKVAIQQGAEKVHPGLYNYNFYPGTPGKSNLMGYGRVNGFNSLNIILANKDTEKEKSDRLFVVSPAFDQLKGNFDSMNKPGLMLQVLDLSGKVRINSELNKRFFQIPLPNLAPGIYLVRVLSDDKPICPSQKFVKF